MPQPRRHKDNAARQKAYRDRVRAREAAEALPSARQPTPGEQGLVDRLIRQDERARAGEAY